MRGLARAGKRASEMAFNAGGGAVNWFPGHMAAASRAIRDRLKLADLVLEVRDARVSATLRSAPFALLGIPASFFAFSNKCRSVGDSSRSDGVRRNVSPVCECVM
jgi:hypothetical protein